MSRNIASTARYLITPLEMSTIPQLPRLVPLEPARSSPQDRQHKVTLHRIFEHSLAANPHPSYYNRRHATGRECHSTMEVGRTGERRLRHHCVSPTIEEKMLALKKRIYHVGAMMMR